MTPLLPSIAMLLIAGIGLLQLHRINRLPLYRYTGQIFILLAITATAVGAFAHQIWGAGVLLAALAGVQCWVMLWVGASNQ